MGQQNDPSLISERTVLGRSCTHSCTEQMYTQLYLGTGSEQMYTQLSKCVHTVLIILAIAAESSELDRLSTVGYGRIVGTSTAVQCTAVPVPYPSESSAFRGIRGYSCKLNRAKLN
jgi:hypothetical protein